MSAIEAVAVGFGGSAALLAMLGYLARSIITQLLSKDLENFKASLSQASIAAAEELKHRLSLVAHEHHVRFSRLHEKQAQILEDIHSRLLDFEDASETMALANNNTPEHLMEFALRRAEDAKIELSGYIRRHELYLPSESSTRLHTLLETVSSLLSECSKNLIDKKLSEGDGPEYFPESKEAWNNVHKYLEHEAPVVRRTVQDDFRKRLGSEMFSD